MNSDEENSFDSRQDVPQYLVSIPPGTVQIAARQSLRPCLPSLNASCLDEESGERTDAPAHDVHRSSRSRQLQVFLPRTPNSPCPSPFSGPWHGRPGDTSSSSSSPASNKSSPASNTSSPGSSNLGNAIDQAFGDTKVYLPGVTTEPNLPRLTRRHTYPKFSVVQEMAHSSKRNVPALPAPPAPEENRQKQGSEEVSVRASSLEEAVTLQQPEMVSYYLEQGCDPNGEAGSKVSPLIIAASAGNEKIVKLLLAAGANIDFEDASQGTALHHAAAGGNRGVVKLLLVAGAKMFHKTNEGYLAVQLTNDSRIRHLLTCRMRSSSDQNLESARNLVLSQKQVTSRSSKPEVRNQVAPFQIPPLPRNEHGFVETMMQRVSPRSETRVSPRCETRSSPRSENTISETTLQRVSPRSESVACATDSRIVKELQKAEGSTHKGKFKVLETAGEAENRSRVGDKPMLSRGPERSTSSLTKAESSPIRRPNENATNRKQETDAGRTSRKSVQFIQEPACKNCGKGDCGGICENQLVTENRAKVSSSEGTTKASSSEGVAEKLFSEPQAKTTGGFNWTKGELLGEGAYGKVFSGLNQSTGELMAVKQLKIDAAEGDKAVYLAAMEREIDLYKKLRHKHIVGYINMEQDDKNESLYIFLEYVSGGSIQSMLERFGRFSESLVRVYTRQLLLGLQYLHENKIVHRDIKGGNVLVDAVGVVKLADFGASKAFHDPTVTNECKSIRGSVFWMAPEVIKGDGYGRRADIWSVGCTVIEMLTAMHPWPDIDNTWSAIFHIAKASSGPPLPSSASDCATDFLQQCFQLDPLLRPTAAQLLEHRFVSLDPEEQ